MSDNMGADPGPDEPVGSVADEAAKLFAALSGFAQGARADPAGSAKAASSGLAAGLHDVNEHLATGGVDCRYCPLCQVIHAVRETSPEVKQHLAVAASSLMQAAAGALATQLPKDGAGSPVEKIDLDDATDWDETP